MAAKFNIVGSIDFGTTYSGWAFSFGYDFKRDPTFANVKHWQCGSASLCTEKTPTVALINPDGKTLLSFGYDAENKYRELVDNEEHESYFYFRRFKMALYHARETLNRDLVIEDEMKHALKAIDVFAMCINYLVNDMMKSVNDQLSGTVTTDEVQWVLTVPAIWSDGAKQFMREAAIQAGVNKQCVHITLEPEAASMFCRHLSFTNTVDGSDVSKVTFAVGSKYLILDAGGGTIDTTVHEVLKKQAVKEIHAASGGDWGGTMVDKAFETMLETVIGTDVYEKFKLDETDDWLDLWRDFEAKKKTVFPDQKSNIIIRIPSSLYIIYETMNEIPLIEYIRSSIYAHDIVPRGQDKLKFKASFFHTLFEESIQRTVQLVEELLNVTQASTILMVGGYSESPMLQHAVKTSFPNIKVIIPSGASSAILRGALITGHEPDSILERVLRYTYGFRTSVEFDAVKHPEGKRMLTDSGDCCCDIFDKVVSVDQSVRFGEKQMKKEYTTVDEDQTEMRLALFASNVPNPTYTDDPGCQRVGEIIVKLEGKYNKPKSATVKVNLIFGGTEIVVKAFERKTKKVSKAKVNFLG